MKKLVVGLGVLVGFIGLIIGGYAALDSIYSKYDHSEYGNLPDESTIVREGDARVAYVMKTIDESGEVNEREFTAIQPLTEKSIIKLNIKDSEVHSYDVITVEELPASVKKVWDSWEE